MSKLKCDDCYKEFYYFGDLARHRISDHKEKVIELDSDDSDSDIQDCSPIINVLDESGRHYSEEILLQHGEEQDEEEVECLEIEDPTQEDPSANVIKEEEDQPMEEKAEQIQCKEENVEEETDKNPLDTSQEIASEDIKKEVDIIESETPTVITKTRKRKSVDREGNHSKRPQVKKGSSRECNWCFETFSSKETLSNHKSNRSDDCLLTQEVSEHLRGHSSTFNECQLCTCVFDDVLRLKSHIKVVHRTAPVYNCPVCKTHVSADAIGGRQAFVEHVKTMHMANDVTKEAVRGNIDDKKVNVDDARKQVNKVLVTEPGLTKSDVTEPAKVVDSSPRPLSKNITYTVETSAVPESNKQEKSVPTSTGGNAVSNETKIKCNHCFLIYRSKSALDKHIKSSHNQSSGVSQPCLNLQHQFDGTKIHNRDKLICSICDTMFDMKSVYHEHNNTRTKYCLLYQKVNKYLNANSSTEHTCGFCNVKKKTILDLQKHQFVEHCLRCINEAACLICTKVIKTDVSFGAYLNHWVQHLKKKKEDDATEGSGFNWELHITKISAGNANLNKNSQETETSRVTNTDVNASPYMARNTNTDNPGESKSPTQLIKPMPSKDFNLVFIEHCQDKAAVPSNQPKLSDGLRRLDPALMGATEYCDYCPQTVAYSLDHMMEVHPELLPYRCSGCKKGFQHLMKYQYHVANCKTVTN